ncbi:PAS domain-containing hybrid sensor histidine kinase/response regulator [Marinifilum sp. D714]|uniref:PAS domain-containing hybrid sensor histidine kinase/response regulator n=1 Tax=Marinifilum sp. D714 TaxID=2937523 RepID=UPI0027CDC671|nr:PAS domain-containing hybrid sensor histidine kinase/response regulator [Marinifilum sp. D714]MDQ2179434.1 PAS domain S-box protein [Marinifilum sp. D714]
MNQPHINNIAELHKEIDKLRKQIDFLNSRKHDFFGNYYDILSNEKVVAFCWLFNKNQILWSDCAETVFGLKNTTFGSTKESFLNCIKHEDTTNFVDNLSECFSNKSINCESTFRLSEKNKSIVWIKASCKIEYDLRGEPIEIRGILKDITPIKETEEERHLNNLRYQTLFNYSPVPLWEEEFSELYQYLDKLKQNGITNFKDYFNEHPESLALCSQKIKVTDVNLATLKLHDAGSKEELLGNLDKIFTPRSYEVFKDEVIALANGQKEFETEGEIKTLSGIAKQIYLKLSIDYNSLDSAKAMLATIDITDRKKADAALAESERKFRTSFEASDVGMAIVGEDKKFRAINSAFCKMMESTPEDLKKNNFIDITHPEDIELSQQHYQKCKESKQAFTIEKRYLTHNGNVKWGLTSVSPIFNSKNKFLYTIVHVQDITNRKYSEEELLKSNKEYEVLAEEYKDQNEELIKAIEIAKRSDRLKSEFLQNLSHEIRTPMNAILGFTDFLELESITPTKRKQYISIIKNSGFQLLRIIDDILEISALETKHVQLNESEFNLNSLMTELFTIFQPQAKKQNLSLYLHKDLNDENCIIHSDEVKLSKILVNLIENSLKYTNSGSIEIGYHVNENTIELYVKDTGIGIDTTRHSQIFERFSQAESEISNKQGGLGLGLSIVKENVKLLHGKIKLISKVDEGSKFIIELKNCLIPNQESNTKPCEKGNNCNILIVEDEEINYLYFESLIEEIAPECHLEHAKNGLEAIKLFKQKEFKLVFMDIKMPEMNGYEASMEIIKIKPEQKIIAQTAYSTSEDKIKAKLAGCNDFVSKPISIKTMQKLLAKHLIY